MNRFGIAPRSSQIVTHPLLDKGQHVLGLERQIEHRTDAGQQFKHPLDGLLGQRAERRTALGRRHVRIVVIAVSTFEPQLLLRPFAHAVLLVFGQHLLELPIGEVRRVDVAKGVG